MYDLELIYVLKITVSYEERRYLEIILWLKNIIFFPVNTLKPLVFTLKARKSIDSLLLDWKAR